MKTCTILKIQTDENHIVTVTFYIGHPRSKVKGHGAKWKIIYMFLSMNNSNYMSNRNRFKDIGTFLSKKSLMSSHVTRNALDDPKSSAVFIIL